MHFLGLVFQEKLDRMARLRSHLVFSGASRAFFGLGTFLSEVFDSRFKNSVFSLA